MTRQTWQNAIALGFCVSWLAGCTHGSRHESAPAAATPLAARPPSPAQESPPVEERVAAAPPSPSPYSPVIAPPYRPVLPEVTPTVAPQTPPAGFDIQKTALHPNTVAPELPPVEPPRVEQPRPLPPAVEAVKPPPDPPLLGALRCLLEKRSGDAVGQLLHYDKPTQDLLLCLLPAVARLGEGGLDQATPEELAHLMAQLESALSALRPRSALVIDRMCYCRDIDRYGVFEELPEQHPFRPGELVEVYVAVRNYTCAQHGDHFEICLASTLEIKDGDKAAQPEKKPVTREHLDRSRTPRHDHFFSYRFYVPENLPPGRYTLQLKIADQLSPSKREAQRSLDLRVSTRPGS
ncbi:MAG: hypothetical protein JNM56_10885 [Planctomycetia bacterium]|nr:hypothetical protein [Planctomycetia bacterium]